jgi:hypothetical protein
MNVCEEKVHSGTAASLPLVYQAEAKIDSNVNQRNRFIFGCGNWVDSLNDMTTLIESKVANTYPFQCVH